MFQICTNEANRAREGVATDPSVSIHRHARAAGDDLVEVIDIDSKNRCKILVNGDVALQSDTRMKTVRAPRSGARAGLTEG